MSAFPNAYTFTHTRIEEAQHSKTKARLLNFMKRVRCTKQVNIEQKTNVCRCPREEKKRQLPKTSVQMSEGETKKSHSLTLTLSQAHKQPERRKVRKYAGWKRRELVFSQRKLDEKGHAVEGVRRHLRYTYI